MRQIRLNCLPGSDVDKIARPRDFVDVDKTASTRQSDFVDVDKIARPRDFVGVDKTASTRQPDCTITSSIRLNTL